ncbi:LrgB family protein [Anaerobacillus sp. MEB173]|uniref:LrgB family protein n=1 Tax=Anaerobacillus sp. MEB173 TaxID=3383345 RepID=UPI003F90CBD0
MGYIAISLITIIVTLVIYHFSKKLYMRFQSPFLLPLLVGTIAIILLLVVLDISYETYMTGGQWIEKLLGPAVVALAYPLYKQWTLLKKYFIPIIAGVTVGAVIGVTSGFTFSVWMGIEELTVYSLVPKSVTTPVAMDIAHSLGGAPPLASVFVMIAGIGGVVFGPTLLKWCRIHHFLGKGIGFGSASHAIGTSKALEDGEKEGAISSIAMTLSAIVVSIIGPVIVLLLK